MIEDINIEEKFIELSQKIYKPRKPLSINYGIIDLNDENIQTTFGPLVKNYFEEVLNQYKPKKSNIKTDLLNELNVVSDHNEKNEIRQQMV